jgi:predicted Fe-Mo cluster-binding NifX family protein
MRLVYPTDDNTGYLSRLGAHFGKAKYYTVVTLQDETISDIELYENPGHGAGGCGDAVSNIMSLSPDALVVRGIGAPPAKKFDAVGLELFFDKNSPTIQDSLELFVKAKLPKVNGGTCSAH